MAYQKLYWLFKSEHVFQTINHQTINYYKFIILQMIIIPHIIIIPQIIIIRPDDYYPPDNY